ETACFGCLRIRRAASLGVGTLGDAVWGEPPCAGGGPALTVAAAAVAAAHALRWLAIGDASLPGTLFALEVVGGIGLSSHHVLRVPRCPDCSPVGSTAGALPWYQPSRLEDAA